MTADHPIGEIRVQEDEGEAAAFLVPGVSVGDVVDLKMFEGFRPGMTPEAAEALHGKPSRIVRSEWETAFRYEKAGAVVELVQKESLSSADDRRIVRHVVRVPVNDPPFSERLPSSLKRLWNSNPELRLVTVVSKVPSDPIVRFEIHEGRVRAVTLGPSPSWLKSPPS